MTRLLSSARNKLASAGRFLLLRGSRLSATKKLGKGLNKRPAKAQLKQATNNPCDHKYNRNALRVKGRKRAKFKAALAQIKKTRIKLPSKQLLSEELNFLLTNRIPRRYATLFMGWFSSIKNPALAKVSIGAWRMFDKELDLSESRTQKFNSLQECFTRELKAGARQIDKRKDIIVSPSDGIVGAFGTVKHGQVYQAKGFPYQLSELIPDPILAQKYEGGTFVTLRLKASMYHRFHAPTDCTIHDVTYISGDTWNVNPIAIKRVEKLFCKNERLVMELHSSDTEQSITLVPVAAILVASMKLHAFEKPLDLRYRGPNQLSCNQSYKKGDQLGYFRHGSTIVIFASKGYRLLNHITQGQRINMGQPLFSLINNKLPVKH